MKKVMIVDDNYLSVEGIVKNIDWTDLDASVCHVGYSGSEALAAMKREPADLIISDIEMPNLDGISLSSQALAINPLVKIILISAYDKFEYAKQAIRLGVCDYIEKPLDYHYLTEKIKKSFRNIDREKRNMEMLERSRPVMTEKFFLDLLQFSGKDAHSRLGKYAEYLNLNLDYNSFNVAILQVENASAMEEELGITQYEMEMMNAQDNLLENYRIFDGIYVVRNFSSIICILGQDTKNTNHFLQAIHKATESFFELYKDSPLEINIGIGITVDNVWDLHVAYENASHALKYRFFFPHKNIFDAKEATGQEFSLVSYSEKREEELIQLICQKNTQAIESWLHDFFQELSQKYRTKNILFVHIYSLLGSILKFLHELNIDTSDLETKIISVYTHFEQFGTYEQFFQWMNTFCTQVCQKLDTSLSSYHDQLCQLVQSYIRENFKDADLCLSDIAKHANVSPAYLSALYKKNCGQSISDTITTCRIDEACQHLAKTTLSLKEISARCGYANQYYFSNSFKKKMGISPSTYREQNRTLLNQS